MCQSSCISSPPVCTAFSRLGCRRSLRGCLRRMPRLRPMRAQAPRCRCDILETVMSSRIFIREDFKYYFTDFVRKGGTPPPFTDKIFAKKKVTDLGGTPPTPFTDIPPKNVLQKVLKMVFFAQKTPFLGQFLMDFFLREGGGPPLHGRSVPKNLTEKS